MKQWNRITSIFWFCWGLLALLVIASCTDNSIATIQPRRGTIQQSFTELARTRLAHVYEISLPLSGKVHRVILKPGDKIEANQVLVRLDQLPWQQAVKRAEADLADAQGQYQYQTLELTRIQILRKKGFATAADVDREQTQFAIKAAQLKSAEAALAIARYQLGQTVIRSPIGGVVLKRYTQGQLWLASGSPLLQLGNFEDLEAVAEILTEQAQQLHVGDRVRLVVHGVKGELLGTIQQIEPQGFTKRSSLGIEEQRVFVIIALPRTEAVATQLGIDFQLQATFLIEPAVKDALIVPRFSVLQDVKGRFYVVKVLKSRKLQKQLVSVGIQTDRDIQILSGLEENDSIVEQPTVD
jgi:HlyD family secretion protein